MSVTSAERLQELAGKINQLPTLPTVYIRVAELMRHHAGEQGDHEDDVLDRGGPAALGIGGKADPGQ